MEMEYCDRGGLYEFISTYTQHQVNLGNLNKGLLMNDLTLLKVIFYQIIDAVSSLHNKAGFAHMDIKLENILISKEGHLKLCDFGFSTYGNNLVTKKLGTEAYMAPEIYDARYNPCLAKPTDIFSLGVLFFILAFGAPPFHSAEYSDTYFRYLKMKPGSTDYFKFHPHSRALYAKGLIDDSLQTLLISMLQADPQNRV